MTRQLLIILTILFATCGHKNATNEKNKADNVVKISSDSLETFSINKATFDDFAKAKINFKDKTLYDTTTYKKKDGIIKLPIDEKWQPFVIYSDTLVNTDEGGIREYKYLGQFDNIGLYIVEGIFYEHSECYLINKRIGNQITIWNEPIITTDEKFIANLSMPFGLEGVPNGLQIWRIDRHKENEVEPISISKYLELDQQIWVPNDLVWETDNSLLIRVVSVDKFWNKTGQVNDKDYYYLRIKLK